MRAREFCLFALAALLALAPAATAVAGSEFEASESRVKAVFLRKFCDYVEWPAGTFDSSETSLTIGVMEADAVADELEQIVLGQTADERPVTVRKLRQGASIAGLHVLFVGRRSSGKLPDIVSSARGRPMLVVSESADGLQSGGAINFIVMSGKVRFDVALPSADSRGLKISSRLLAVARRVVISH